MRVGSKVGGRRRPPLTPLPAPRPGRSTFFRCYGAKEDVAMAAEGELWDACTAHFARRTGRTPDGRDGRRGHGGTEILARRVGEAFDAIPAGLTLEPP
ncbi:hypothetical protein [Streptomyces sp. DH37]|uniref:hypothetical protein n=1 Tax=Streptomyces sp. DH37 TaxID=3040122 RepID=UPI00244188C1|nr:hypothetical protein [Streptomyces sp. DH37]MDG9702020.1 hypothetical protein [Streptomyces sp. DH37]